MTICFLPRLPDVGETSSIKYFVETSRSFLYHGKITPRIVQTALPRWQAKWWQNVLMLSRRTDSALNGQLDLNTSQRGEGEILSTQFCWCFA